MVRDTQPGCVHVLGMGKTRSVRSRGGITCAFRPNRLLTGCPLGRARHAHFDRAATVRERSRSFETFDQPIFARRLKHAPPSILVGHALEGLAKLGRVTAPSRGALWARLGKYLRFNVQFPSRASASGFFEFCKYLFSLPCPRESKCSLVR